MSNAYDEFQKKIKNKFDVEYFTIHAYYTYTSFQFFSAKY